MTHGFTWQTHLLTERTAGGFPQTAGEMPFGGDFFTFPSLSGECFFWMFLSHAFYACQTFHNVECLILAALLTIQFFADLRFVFCLNFSGVLTDINILYCTSSEGRSRCNAFWELDRLALLEKEMTPFLWISLLTNKLTDVYANLVLVINERLLNMNTTQVLAFNVRAQFWSGNAS